MAKHWAITKDAGPAWSLCYGRDPANTIHWPNAGLMLARRLRRRPNINPALGQCIEGLCKHTASQFIPLSPPVSSSHLVSQAPSTSTTQQRGALPTLIVQAPYLPLSGTRWPDLWAICISICRRRVYMYMANCFLQRQTAVATTACFCRAGLLVNSVSTIV